MIHSLVGTDGAIVQIVSASLGLKVPQVPKDHKDLLMDSKGQLALKD